MSEAKAATHEQGAIWARYRHREKPEIEYDVEVFASNRSLIVHTKGLKEPCFRIRTIRNLSHHEETHQPAFTYMPADKFLDVYEKAA